MKFDQQEKTDVTHVSAKYVFDVFGTERGMALLNSANLLDSGFRAPDRITKLDYWFLCVDSINLFNDEGHACLSRPLPKSTWSLIFSAVSQAKTLGAGLKKMVELLPLIETGLQGQLSYCSRYAQLTIKSGDDLITSDRVERYIDLISTVFLCVLSWGAGKSVLPTKIKLSAKLNPEDGFLLGGLSTLESEIAGEGKTLCFQLDDLDLPLRAKAYEDWAVPETLMFQNLYARLSDGSLTPDSSLIESVRQILEENPMDQTGVALALGYSTSTLQRKLSQSGTNFREISRDIRKAQLKSLLRTSASIDDIAALMAFSDRRSLTRACRDWFGVTPTMYRAQKEIH